MTQTQRDPAGSGGVSPTDAAVPTIPEHLHAELQWTYELGYEQGYRAGLDAANAAMDALIAAWLAPPYSHGAPPAGAADVVHRMLRAMQREISGIITNSWSADFVLHRRVELRQVLTTDHPGDPVPAWGGDR